MMWLSFDQFFPRAIPEPRRHLGRCDHVGEHHRGQRAVERGFLLADPVQESLHLRDQRLRIAEVRTPLIGGELHDAGDREERCGALELRSIPQFASTEQKRGGTDRRQHVADVRLLPRAREREGRGWGRREPHELAQPSDECRVVDRALASPIDGERARPLGRSPLVDDAIAPPDRVVCLERPVRGRRDPCERTVRDQRLDPFGERRREQRGQRRSLRRTEQGRAFHAHRPHHGVDVVHARLERREGRNPIRQPRSLLVVHDHAAASGEASEERGTGGATPTVPRGW